MKNCPYILRAYWQIPLENILELTTIFDKVQPGGQRVTLLHKHWLGQRLLQDFYNKNNNISPWLGFLCKTRRKLLRIFTNFFTFFLPIFRNFYEFLRMFTLALTSPCAYLARRRLVKDHERSIGQLLSFPTSKCK